MKRMIALIMIVALLFVVPGCESVADETVGSSDVQMNHEATEPVTEIAPETSDAASEDAAGTDDTAAASEADPAGEPTATTEDLTESTGDITEESTETSGAVAPETTEPTEKTTEATEPTEPPHSHSYSSSTVAATCTAQGYTVHSCACGESYTDSYTAALGHAYVDTVIAPTTEAGGYTQHTCSRCGDSYTDTYTEQLWWDTEEKVAQICAEANAYIASIGGTVDPTAACWVAPDYTRSYSESQIRSRLWEFIDWYKENGYSTLFVTYEPYRDGWWIHVKYAI